MRMLGRRRKKEGPKGRPGSQPVSLETLVLWIPRICFMPSGYSCSPTETSLINSSTILSSKDQEDDMCPQILVRRRKPLEVLHFY
jgi:hypothetical protein